MRPQLRHDWLITTATTDGLVVYDEATTDLHAIPNSIAAIWRACDGARDLDAIATMTGVSSEEARAAVEQLHTAGLLEGELQLTLPRANRRELAKKTALGVAIVSITAPVAAQAATVCTAPPRPLVELGMQSTSDPRYGLLNIVVSGFCPSTTYPVSIEIANFMQIWSGSITTNASGSATLSPVSYVCHYDFQATVGGFSSPITEGSC